MSALDLPRLSLSIVSHGHGALLDRLLDDLNGMDGLRGTRVVVTLNLFHESFNAARWPHLDFVVLRNVSPRGFGANHNVAFCHCNTPWFAVLNPDLRFKRGNPFPALIATASQSERIGVIAPRIQNSEGQLEDAVRSNLTPWSLVGRRLLQHRKPLVVSRVAQLGTPFYWLAGMCLLFATDPFRELGGFDERYFLYCEDYDLCARLYAAGYALAVDPQVRVVHDAQRDSHHSRRHLRWHLVSLVKVWTSRIFWRVTFGGTTLRSDSSVSSLSP